MIPYRETQPLADRNLSFLNSKMFDLIAAGPLIVWYGFALIGITIRDLGPIFGSNYVWSGRNLLALCSQLATTFFLALQLVLFFIRRLPIEKAPGVLPRVAAIFGANLGLAFLALRRAPLSPTVEALSTAIVLIGTFGSIWSVFTLGRAFSILPQARKLVTGGPYRVIRHPLYLAEQVSTVGIMLQFAQPWSLLIALASLAAQIPRMQYEERVLRTTFSAYASYAEQKKRLIPGIY